MDRTLKVEKGGWESPWKRVASVAKIRQSILRNTVSAYVFPGRSVGTS